MYEGREKVGAVWSQFLMVFCFQATRQRIPPSKNSFYLSLASHTVPLDEIIKETYLLSYNQGPPSFHLSKKPPLTTHCL